MPQGIVATVEDGFATLDFVDRDLRGPSLNKLLEIGGPESIESISRRGPRKQYRVLEGNAREAGLLDDAAPQARGLDAQGNATEDAFAGPGGDVGAGPGVIASGVVDVAAGDTGFATALSNADPNTGSSVTGADGPAAKGTVNFHTPVAEYTSAHAFVGKVPNADVLHNRSQVVTGTGTMINDDKNGHPPLHADVIAYVETDNAGFKRTEGRREPQVPAAHIANALGAQTGALGSDPGGFAPQPGEAPGPAPLPSPERASKPSKSPFAPKGDDTGADAPSASPTGQEGRPAGIPDGEPDEDWKRAELNAYATWKGVKNPEGMANKAEVLAAINKAEAAAINA